MPVRYFIIPLVETVHSTNPWRSDRDMKYINNQHKRDGLSVQGFDWRHNGAANVAIAKIEADTTTLNTLAAYPDVLRFPANINSTLTAARVNAVKARLDDLDLPSGWVNVSLTYKNVIHNIVRLFKINKYMYSLDGLKENLFAGGLTRNSTLSQIPAGKRARLRKFAENHGMDTTELTGSTTIQAAFIQLMAAQTQVQDI